MKRLLASLVILLLPLLAAAQSSPGLVYGQVPSAAQWNSYFAAKMNYFTGGLPITSGGTGATTQAGARAALGISSSLLYPIGTSGATIPLLSGVNTWGAVQTFN